MSTSSGNGRPLPRPEHGRKLRLALVSHFFAMLTDIASSIVRFVGRESGAIVDRQMRRLLADLVKLEISSPGRKSQNDIRADMAAQYVVGALMSTVTWWLDRNIKFSPEQVDGLFRQMTLPALQSFRAIVMP